MSHLWIYISIGVLTIAAISGWASWWAAATPPLPGQTGPQGFQGPKGDKGESGYLQLSGFPDGAQLVLYGSIGETIWKVKVPR